MASTNWKEGSIKVTKEYVKETTRDKLSKLQEVKKPVKDIILKQKDQVIWTFKMKLLNKISTAKIILFGIPVVFLVGR